MHKTPEFHFNRALNIVGNKSQLAKVLQIRAWAVCKWDKCRIPANRCLPIEKATHGEVTAEQLRPDLNWSYLRAQYLKENEHENAHQSTRHKKNQQETQTV